ncbi:ATP-binding protein [Listeria monocytogenes]|uniref:ATP-binding protein n=1 Tax=Listeria innocua TaxID=1642 RepID=UPI0012F3C79F|nr:ATP-binding protein [Listeria innocua]ECB9830363.1 ATP-binding protein [Listeria monocytogenes]MBC1385592.1 ATP-binding protein [Listeria innocua]
MSKKEELEEIIKGLFYQNTEGEYWDFKEYPYFYAGQTRKEINKKKKDLLHDIICMANNMSNQEAYLIMGISDAMDIVGIEAYQGRWKQENYLDFLQSKRWAGDTIPSIELRNIRIGGTKELDILVIHKSSNVPFYIKEKFLDVQPNQIYLRKGAKNTAINKEAEIQDIEKLWEYRFGLIPYPKERALNYMKEVEAWEEMRSSDDSISWYYRKFPEYTLELFDNLEDKRLPPFVLMQTNASGSRQILRLKYHQTILLEFAAYYVDESRGVVIHPMKAYLELFENSEYVNTYYYYIADSAEVDLMYLLKYLLKREDGAWSRHLSMIPIFDNIQQKEAVEKLIMENAEKYRKKIVDTKQKYNVGHSSGLTAKKEEFAVLDMATTVLVKETLEENRI